MPPRSKRRPRAGRLPLLAAAMATAAANGSLHAASGPADSKTRLTPAAVTAEVLASPQELDGLSQNVADQLALAWEKGEN